MILTVSNLVKVYHIPVIRKIAYRLNLLMGADIPTNVRLSKTVDFVHNSVGTVLHNNTVVGEHVKIYQNVTIGRGDIYKKPSTDFQGFVIEDNVILCAGAKVINSHGTLTVARGSIIAANAVLLNSTGIGEIWAGIPARRIGCRDDFKTENR